MNEFLAQLESWFDPRFGGVNKDARTVNLAIQEALAGSEFRLVNLTYMSEFRADAHPATWLGKKDAVAVYGQDCMHWCAGHLGRHLGRADLALLQDGERMIGLLTVLFVDGGKEGKLYLFQYEKNNVSLLKKMFHQAGTISLKESKQVGF